MLNMLLLTGENFWRFCPKARRNRKQCDLHCYGQVVKALDSQSRGQESQKLLETYW